MLERSSEPDCRVTCLVNPQFHAVEVNAPCWKSKELQPWPPE